MTDIDQRRSKTVSQPLSLYTQQLLRSLPCLMELMLPPIRQSVAFMPIFFLTIDTPCSSARPHQSHNTK